MATPSLNKGFDARLKQLKKKYQEDVEQLHAFRNLNIEDSVYFTQKKPNNHLLNAEPVHVLYIKDVNEEVTYVNLILVKEIHFFPQRNNIVKVHIVWVKDVLFYTGSMDPDDFYVEAIEDEGARLAQNAELKDFYLKKTQREKDKEKAKAEELSRQYLSDIQAREIEKAEYLAQKEKNIEAEARAELEKMGLPESRLPAFIARIKAFYDKYPDRYRLKYPK